MTIRRFATWNVESIRAHREQVVDWIDRHEPDLICLQETKAGVRKFPTQPFTERGYELVIAGGDDGRAGVAVASRLELDDVSVGIPGAVAPLDAPRSISVMADGLRVHTAYAPNGRKVGTPPHALKLAWFALFAAWLEADRSVDERQLMLGDLNIAPADIDVWDASRYRRRNLTSPPERQAFARLLDDGELVDVVRARHGDAAVFTWWNRRSDFYATDRGWRLDHVLADPVTAAAVTSVSIDRVERGRDGSTDHAPILVELDRAGL